MKIHSCQPIRNEIPPFKGYRYFNGSLIQSSDYRMWKNNIFTKDVFETVNAKFKKLTLIDSKTNKPLLQKVVEIFKKK